MIDWEAIRKKQAEKPRNPDYPTEEATGIIVKTNDEREYELKIRTWPKDGRKTILISGYWEYDPSYALQRDRLEKATDKRLCVDMGQDIMIDEAGTAAIFDLADKIRNEQALVAAGYDLDELLEDNPYHG